MGDVLETGQMNLGAREKKEKIPFLALKLRPSGELFLGQPLWYHAFPDRLPNVIRRSVTPMPGRDVVSLVCLTPSSHLVLL